LSVLGASVRIPYTATEAIFRQAILDNFPFVSEAQVGRSDVSAVERHWTVTFTSYQGDVPSMVTNGTGLTSVSASATANVNITELVRGSVQDVQMVTFKKHPIGGDFTLSYKSHTTSSLAFNSTARDIRDALEALQVIGEVLVSQTYNGSIPVWKITFVDLPGDVSVLGATSNLWAGNTVSLFRLFQSFVMATI